MLIKLICIAVAVVAELLLLKYMYERGYEDGFEKAEDMVDVAIDTQKLMENMIRAGELLQRYTPEEVKTALKVVEMNREYEEGE